MWGGVRGGGMEVEEQKGRVESIVNLPAIILCHQQLNCSDYFHLSLIEEIFQLVLNLDACLILL